MAKQDRRERHLMRQRGAGSRNLIPAFGFTFGDGSKKAQSHKRTTPEKKSPSKPAGSARRKSVVYNPHPSRSPRPSASPKANKTAPKSPTTKRDSVTSHLAQSSTQQQHDVKPPKQATPVRKARFYEHLDDDVPPMPAPPAQPIRKPSTRARKRKTVTMPRRKRAPTKQAHEAEGASGKKDVTGERAELIEAGLLETAESNTPNGSRKRKQASSTVAQTDGVPAKATKKAKLQPEAESSTKAAWRSPSKARLREVFNLHSSSKVNVSLDQPKVAGDATENARTNVQSDDKQSTATSKKSGSKVSAARKMFRIKDADDSGDESWFRPRRKK